MKNNTKKNITIIILMLLLILIIFGFVFYNKKETSVSPENSNVEQKSYKFNGLFKNNNKALLLYEEDNNIYYVGFFDYPNVYTMGVLKKNNNVAFGKINITLKDNTINIQNDSILEGIYSKEKEITFEELWNLGYGDTKLFDSKYNGKYQDENGIIMIYQVDDKTARVLIDYENEKVSYKFPINEFGSLAYFNGEKKYDISYLDSSDTIIFSRKANDSEAKDDFHLINKVSNISMKDVINSNVSFK